MQMEVEVEPESQSSSSLSKPISFTSDFDSGNYLKAELVPVNDGIVGKESTGNFLIYKYLI